MLKAAGVILILFGCGGLGWHAVLRHTARIKMLAELEQALQYLYGEIEYSGSDMMELLDRLAARQGYFGDLWKNMGDCLQKNFPQPHLKYFQGMQLCLPVHIPKIFPNRT